MATIRSFLMLDPRNMARNPVMFLVEVGLGPDDDGHDRVDRNRSEHWG